MESFPIRGWGRITVRRNGVVIYTDECHNTITELGDALVASRMSDLAEDPISHMAIGDGSGGGSTSTALDNEIDRVALDSTTLLTGGDDNIVEYEATFAPGACTITEVGLLNDSSGGTLFNYLAPSPIVIASIDDVTFTLSVRFGAST